MKASISCCRSADLLVVSSVRLGLSSRSLLSPNPHGWSDGARQLQPLRSRADPPRRSVTESLRGFLPLARFLDGEATSIDVQPSPDSEKPTGDPRCRESNARQRGHIPPSQCNLRLRVDRRTKTRLPVFAILAAIAATPLNVNLAEHRYCRRSELLSKPRPNGLASERYPLLVLGG